LPFALEPLPIALDLEDATVAVGAGLTTPGAATAAPSVRQIAGGSRRPRMPPAALFVGVSSARPMDFEPGCADRVRRAPDQPVLVYAAKERGAYSSVPASPSPSVGKTYALWLFLDAGERGCFAPTDCGRYHVRDASCRRGVGGRRDRTTCVRRPDEPILTATSDAIFRRNGDPSARPAKPGAVAAIAGTGRAPIEGGGR
jgi:hypothetical protein